MPSTLHYTLQGVGDCFLVKCWVLFSTHCVRSMTYHTAVRSYKAVTAYFLSKQVLPFGFAEQHTLVPHYPPTYMGNICTFLDIYQLLLPAAP